MLWRFKFRYNRNGGHSKNQKLPLTKNEFAILKMLMEHPQQVFTKDMIYEQLWNETLEGTEMLSMFISATYAKKLLQ